jgi:hypothetical protein
MENYPGENSVQCPVCQQYTFDEEGDHTMCFNCGWLNDELLIAYPDLHGALEMSLNEAKKAYAEGRPIE